MNNKKVGMIAVGSLMFLIIGIVLVVFSGSKSAMEYTSGVQYTQRLLSPGEQNGGNYAFSGVVTDSVSKQPLPNAQVVALRYQYPEGAMAYANIGVGPMRAPLLALSTEKPFGESKVEVLYTDSQGQYQLPAAQYDQVQLEVRAQGHHASDTPIILAEGEHEVDISAIPSDQPPPQPKGSNVIDTGFRDQTSGQELAATDDLKARAVAGLQCQGIDVTEADIIGDIETNNDFSGDFETHILLKSDDCTSITTRSRTYNHEEAKIVHTTKGDFILVDKCVNLIIPAPPEKVATPTPQPTATPTTPPGVNIHGNKVELIGTKEFTPNVTFTFRIEELGITTQTDLATGEFRFTNLPLFQDPNIETVTVTICEILTSGDWQPADPSDGCKSVKVHRGDTEKDAGKWKNRTCKLECKISTPTPKATFTPVPSATPTNTPRATNTPTSTLRPTNTPTSTPRPTNTPGCGTCEPPRTPVPTPTNYPTDVPTPTDVFQPTNTPTNTPGCDECLPPTTPVNTPTSYPTDVPTPTAIF